MSAAPATRQPVHPINNADWVATTSILHTGWNISAATARAARVT